MEKVNGSMLKPAIAEARVIPNGVDLGVFKPQDKRRARADLRLPDEAHIVVFAAHGGSANLWKDYPTIEAAAIQASQMVGRQTIVLVIGGRSGFQEWGNLQQRYLPHVSDRSELAKYLAAADVCVHAVRADNFSLWLSESLACGTPVVSVRVGGIPEIVQNGVTGLLVDPGDVASFSQALVALLQNDELRNTMGKAASEYAALHLGLNRMVDDYRRWYEEILSRWRPSSNMSEQPTLPRETEN
jgi:glycosyltransferase involved in cell wall biosynthesis